MDLTFQAPMQYYSLQRQTLLSPPDTSPTERHFHFGPAVFLFLEILVIVLCSSPVAYRTSTNPGGSSFSVIASCFFIQFMGFSPQVYWSGLPFPSPVYHILSELFPMTLLSWVALHSMAHSFTELCKPLHQDQAVINEGDLIHH